MSRFIYKAAPAGGATGGLVEGREEAADERSLRERLRERGLIAVEVRPVGAIDALRSRSGGGSRLTRTDRIWFYRTLARLLKGKAPIEQAISTMVELAPSARVKDACAKVRESLRKGESLDQSVGGVAGLASEQQIALLRVGHASGRLEHSVALIDSAIARSEKIRRTIIGRMIYPAILVVAAVVALWFLASFVIPRFEQTLASVDAKLPIQTSLTFAVANWLVWIIPLLVLAVALLMIAGRAGALPQPFVKRLRTWVERMPFVGNLLWHTRSALLTDTLATMLEGGADLMSALEEAERAMAQSNVGERLGQARRAVREGADLGDAFDQAGVLPPMIGAIVRIGARSGDLPDALRAATDAAMEKQDEQTQRMLTLLEPGVILLLAGVVGWVVFSLVSGMLAINDLGGM
jgi:general secretion pathway protein F